MPALKRGPLKAPEALPIVAQMAEGLSAALETMKQATGIAQEIHDATTVAQTRRKQGESLHALGRTGEAEEAFKDGIARLDSMGETARSGDGKLRLARLYLDLGRLDEAEAMARAAVEQHERAHVEKAALKGQ